MAAQIAGEVASTPTTVEFNDNQFFWEDEFSWTAIAQQSQKTLGGGFVVETSKNVYGRPVTIQVGWITKTDLDTLISLRDDEDQTTMTLTLPDGTTTIDVLFRHEDNPPIIAEPVIEYSEYEGTDFFNVTLKLVKVS